MQKKRDRIAMLSENSNVVSINENTRQTSEELKDINVQE